MRKRITELESETILVWMEDSADNGQGRNRMRVIFQNWCITDHSIDFACNRCRNKSSAKSYALMSDLGFPAAFKLPRFHEGGQLSSLCTVLEMTSRTDGYHTLIRGFYRLTIFDAGLPLSKDGCLSQRTSRVP